MRLLQSFSAAGPASANRWSQQAQARPRGRAGGLPRGIAVLTAILLLGNAACGGGEPPQAPATPAAGPLDISAITIDTPLDPPLSFWRRANNEDAEVLQAKIVKGFEAAYPNIPVEVRTFSDYNTLYSKTLGAISGDRPPDLAAAYENWAAEYYEAGALAPLDPYIESGEHWGLSQADRQDYIKTFLDGTKFAQYGGKTLTFPLNKSAYVLYTNLDVMRSLGIAQPAAGWATMRQHCAQALSAAKKCIAFPLDPSVFTAAVYSQGGSVLDELGRSLLDKPATTAVLTLYEELVRSKLAYAAASKPGAAQEEFLKGDVLYYIDSSSALPALGRRLRPDGWQVTNIPQGENNPKPATSLVGVNVSMLRPKSQALAPSLDQQRRQLAAWIFIKYLSNKEIATLWGLDKSNGYFPVRTSVREDAANAEAFRQQPQFTAAFDAGRHFGRYEPNATGWGEVRQSITEALADMLSGRLTAAAAQAQIVATANQVLGEH